MLKRLLPALLSIAPLVVAAAVAAAPPLDARGQAAYREFLAAAAPRAFALAPGGAHAWVGEAASDEVAEEQALEACRRVSEQTCVLFAVNAQQVFDARRWPTLWGPYPDAAASARAAVGMKRGMRFPDLLLHDAGGRPRRLSDLRGRVLVLHFWGSWCPHCQAEMPSLQRLGRRLDPKKISVALVQVREAVAPARAWLRREKIALAQYDGGARGPRDTTLALAGGGSLADRDVARAFPATYVLGRHGVVLFAQVGPVADWMQYREFLEHAAR